MARQRNTQRREARQQAFLAALGETGIVTLAAQRSGIPASQHYVWSKQEPEYAAQTEAALRSGQAAAGTLRKRSGPKPGYHQGGQRGAERVRRQERFLEEISKGLTKHEAGRVAGVALNAHQQWMNSDSEYAERYRQAYEASEEVRKERTSERLSQASKSRWDDPEAREAWGELQRTLWTPERREAASEQMRQLMEDPEIRKKRIAAARARWDGPNAREENSERAKKMWADPEYREKIITGMRTPESRARSSAGAKKYWDSLTEAERIERTRHMRRTIKGGHKISSIEAATMEALNERELPYLTHKTIGDYAADILIPSLNLDIECDGTWYHAQRPESDAERDAAVAELGYETLRLTEEEIQAGDWSRLDEAIARLGTAR